MTRENLNHTAFWKAMVSIVGFNERKTWKKNPFQIVLVVCWLRYLFYEIELTIVYFFSCVCVHAFLSSQVPAICLQMESHQATLKLWAGAFLLPCLVATTVGVSMLTDLGSELAPELVWDLLKRSCATLKLRLAWFSLESQENWSLLHL